VVEKYLAGEALYTSSRKHDICRNLIHVWIGKYEQNDEWQSRHRSKQVEALYR